MLALSRGQLTGVGVDDVFINLHVGGLVQSNPGISVAVGLVARDVGEVAAPVEHDPVVPVVVDQVVGDDGVIAALGSDCCTKGTVDNTEKGLSGINKGGLSS